MSPRRKQSTKDLGAILSEAVPVVVAEEVQLPAGSPLPHAAAAEAEAPSPEALTAEQRSPAAEAVPVAAEEATAEAALLQEPQAPAAEPLPGPPAHEEGAAALWRKSTIPFRAGQYEEIGHVLADFYLRTDVQLTIAEVVRLGLDKMIEALKEPELREAILVELYRQQRRESLGNEKLKHSKSRGLGDYLAAQGRLPAG